MSQPPAEPASVGADHDDWTLRPWLLGGMLGIAGFLFWLASGGENLDNQAGWRAALMALLFFGPIAFAFSFGRGRWKQPLGFAALAGAVMAGIAWRAVAGGDTYASPQYGFIAGVIATGLALPLFQAGFHRTRWATPYPLVHGFAWGDAIGAAGALAFTGASWLLLVVLSELFHLLKIDTLRHLMEKGWFGWAWSGAAFGAALGVLRNEARILATLQRVVMVVLSILAVPLALGLALFLVAMAISGPDVLWAATRSATPVLLVCAAGAWILTNAIIRDTDTEMSRNRALRVAAMVLAAVVLPLTVFAAISLGTRVAQHGLSPERIWGLIAIAVACAYGVAWLFAVARGWRGGAWPAKVRRANLHLAVAICAVALFLALPILDFGAISARNQVARLESGKVSAEHFDYAALRWDFGDAGRRALARLAASGNAKVAAEARRTQAETERPYRTFEAVPERAERRSRLRFPPGSETRLNPAFSAFVAAQTWRCSEVCTVVELGDGRFALVEGETVTRLRLDRDARLIQEPAVEITMKATPSPLPAVEPKVEVRPWRGRRIYVDGKPVGDPFE